MGGGGGDRERWRVKPLPPPHTCARERMQMHLTRIDKDIERHSGTDRAGFESEREGQSGGGKYGEREEGRR
jgi:hypothetical protein